MTSPSTLPSSLPSAGQTPVSITVSYWIPNDPQQQDEPCSSTSSSSSSSSSSTPTKTETWDASAVPLAVLGLPAGRTPVKPAAGDYSYSGMHDQGPLLPVPRQGGSMAVLLACVDAAKDCNDEYLTGVIHQEKMQHQQEPLNDEEQPIKRPKTT